jgi:hypothetical protein
VVAVVTILDMNGYSEENSMFRQATQQEASLQLLDSHALY